MADSDSQGMSARTTYSNSVKSVLDNEDRTWAPKKKNCCRRRIVSTVESGIFPDDPGLNFDEYVLFECFYLDFNCG